VAHAFIYLSSVLSSRSRSTGHPTAEPSP
jgi:hypothetical protein